MSNPNPHNQWEPGQSGNPAGRPPNEWTWSGLVREAMEEKNLDGEEKKLFVSRALVDRAAEGDVGALREVGNRIDGQAKQSLEVEGTIQHNVIHSVPKRSLESPPQAEDGVIES